MAIMQNTAKRSLAIVIPAYNESQNIRSCLESIAKQTVMPDQVIVVDNNSTDDTIAIAKLFTFVTVLHEPQQGIVYARDNGFNAVQADIIGRIDADTRLKPGWVEHIQRYYANDQHMNRAISGMGYFYNVRWPKLIGKAQHIIAFQLNRVIMGSYILWGSNMALPRHLWQDVRHQIHHQNDIHEDIDLAIHLNKAGIQIDYRKSLLVSVRLRRVHTQRRKLWANLLLWPRTFRLHGYRLWPLAFIGSVLLFLTLLPATIAERIALSFGKQRSLKRRRHI